MRLKTISRRTFLKSAGIAALAVTAAGVLTGCSSSSSSKGNGGSGNVTPAPVPGATEDVNIIFFDDGNLDEITNQPKVIGEGVLHNVLKTATFVNTNDIPEDQFPEGYHVAEPKDLEIRIKDDKKYIFVFVVDYTVTPTTKEVEVNLMCLSDGKIEPVTATIPADATTLKITDFTLPAGHEFYPGARYDANTEYALNMHFMIQKIS